MDSHWPSPLAWCLPPRPGRSTLVAHSLHPQSLALTIPYAMTGHESAASSFASMPSTPVSTLGTDQSIKSEDLMTPTSVRTVSGLSPEASSNRTSLWASNDQAALTRRWDLGSRSSCLEDEWESSFAARDMCEMPGAEPTHICPNAAFQHFDEQQHGGPFDLPLQHDFFSHPDDGPFVQSTGTTRILQPQAALTRYEPVSSPSSIFGPYLGPEISHLGAFELGPVKPERRIAVKMEPDRPARRRPKHDGKRTRSKMSAKSRQAPCPVLDCQGTYSRHEHLLRHLKTKHSIDEIPDRDLRDKIGGSKKVQCAFRIAFGDKTCEYDTERPDNRNQHHGSHCKMHVGQPRNAQLDPELMGQCILRMLPCASEDCDNCCEGGVEHDARLQELRRTSFRSFLHQLKPDKHTNVDKKLSSQKHRNAHLSHAQLEELGFPSCLGQLAALREELVGKSMGPETPPSFQYLSFGRDPGSDGCFWVIDVDETGCPVPNEENQEGKRYLCRYRTRQSAAIDGRES